MTTIEVRISKHKFVQLDHAVHIGNYTMGKLREAGVPVQGVLGVTWIDDGVMTVCVRDDDLVYTWRGEHPLAKVEAIEEEIW